MNITPICPYCNKFSKQVTGLVIYPHRPDLKDKIFYQCAPCDAYVGCHPDSPRPLGRLANEGLRKLKSRAHAAFDPLWRKFKLFNSRGSAYKWLATTLGVKQSDCHIGMMDDAQCYAVIKASSLYLFEAKEGGKVDGF